MISCEKEVTKYTYDKSNIRSISVPDYINAQGSTVTTKYEYNTRGNYFYIKLPLF